MYHDETKMKYIYLSPSPGPHRTALDWKTRLGMDQLGFFDSNKRSALLVEITFGYLSGIIIVRENHHSG
jgi:hypothetical protein